MQNFIFEKFYEENVLSCCCTSKSQTGTFNISTTSSILAASLGVNVLKLLSANSLSLLNALNISHANNFQQAENHIQTNGAAFLHYEYPEKDKNSLVIISDRMFLCAETEKEIENLSNVVKEHSPKHALIICTKEPKLNEISVCSSTSVCEIKDGKDSYYEIVPERFGIKRAEISALTGATPLYNARLTSEILNGKVKDSKLDAVVMNAGAMVYLFGKSKSLLDGIIKAYSAVNTGLSAEKLKSFQA